MVSLVSFKLGFNGNQAYLCAFPFLLNQMYKIEQGETQWKWGIFMAVVQVSSRYISVTAVMESRRNVWLNRMSCMARPGLKIPA